MTENSPQDLGGHTVDNGDGTSTTTDDRGSITHITGDHGGDIHWGGEGGNSNDTSNSSGESFNNTDLDKQHADIVNDSAFTKKLKQILDFIFEDNPDAKISKKGISKGGVLHAYLVDVGKDQALSAGFTTATSETDDSKKVTTHASIDSGHKVTKSYSLDTDDDGQPGFWDKKDIDYSGYRTGVFVPVGQPLKERNVNSLPPSVYGQKYDEAKRAADGYDRSQREKDKQNNDKKQNDKEKSDEKSSAKDDLRFVSDFNKEMFERFGERAKKISESLAESAKGNHLKNAQEALDAFEKYKNEGRANFSKNDRETISRAIKSVDYDEMAKSMAKFSRAFGYMGSAMDAIDLGKELATSIETGQWRNFFVEAEKLFAGKVAAVITAWAFAIILGSPIGILGFALVMASVSALIDDELMEHINDYLGI